jgi:hypothetical protein
MYVYMYIYITHTYVGGSASVYVKCLRFLCNIFPLTVKIYATINLNLHYYYRQFPYCICSVQCCLRACAQHDEYVRGGGSNVSHLLKFAIILKSQFNAPPYSPRLSSLMVPTFLWSPSPEIPKLV